MLLHFLMSFVTGILNSVYASLPPWSLNFGDGNTPGFDHGAVHTMIYYVCMWDHFIPIYDLVLPLIALNFLIFVVTMALKVFFKGASFIPTIGAGG